MGCRRLTLLAAVLLLGACSGNDVQTEEAVTVEFRHSGCGRENEVKSDAFVNETPELTLEYTEEGLLITRTNAMLNCSIIQGGISCDLSVENNIITYRAYETDGPTLKCVCPVKTMTALVGGLKEDTEYILHYTCDGQYLPLNFRYAKGLKITFDLSLYRE
jgi:hypothetical protein